MSTVPEAITAKHMGVKVLGISCITNRASGCSDSPLNHKEVMEAAQKAVEPFGLLLSETIARVT
jgi:purine-nucleoside phosphorylase